MTHPLDTGTWRRDPACATWVFELAAAPGQPLIDAMAACARRMLAALPGFAIPATAEWTTESGGEDAVVHPRGTRIDDATIAATFHAHRDVIQLALDLDLQLVDPSGREVMLEDGARLHLEREDAVLAIWLNLNVDLYARRTFGANRDNDRLARLNGPRLAGFLERLTASTGARLQEIDAPSYADQVSERGFELPPSSPEHTSHFAMTRPYARTNAEAHLFMDLRPCRCGSPDFDRQSTVIDDAGVLCSRYSGPCRSCGTAREFVFELPPTIRPIRNETEFGGDDPSRLLDPGEWLAVADDHAKRQPGTRRDLDIARAAVEEVLKFVPAGAERVPDEAFTTERGRAVRDAEPGRFRRARLEAVLGAYRDLLTKWSQPAPSAPPAPARPASAPIRPAPAPSATAPTSLVATHPVPLDEHPLPALVEALATAAARQQGFEGPELRRQASDLAGQIQTVLRLFQIKAAEQRQRTNTMTELDRLLDAIAKTDSPTGRVVATHRSELTDAFREVDLAQISSGLTALAEWLRNPTQDTGQPVQQLLVRLQAALAAHADGAGKPS